MPTIPFTSEIAGNIAIRRKLAGRHRLVLDR